VRKLTVPSNHAASPSVPSSTEQDRLAALREYAVLDSLPEQGYDDITELAAFICGTPISLISFIDQDKQWFKSRRGLDVTETPRSVSFCAHTLETAETFIVEDAQADPRFKDNPLVLGDPNIRFYAGAPIVNSGGYVLGAVCVIDQQPRSLSSKQISALEALARQVVVLLEQHKSIAVLKQAAENARIADRVLQTSERRLQTFVDSFPALAWMANEDGWIFWYNARWYEYTGTVPEQMEGWGWQSVHDPAVLPDVMQEWTRCIVFGEPFSMVFPLRGADGIFRSFLTRVAPIRNEDGQIVQWFGTNIEIDELQRTRVALEKSEAGLNQVLNATSDAVVSIARDWTLTYLNPAAEQIYGPAQTLVGQNFWEAFPNASVDDSLDDLPVRQQYTRAMNEGIASQFEAFYGDPLNLTIGIEVYPSRDGIVTFSRDVTKLKLAAAAIMQNEKLAAVGRLASSIAHEINNPLEAVTNLLYLALNSQSQDEAQPFLSAADVELRRVSAITSKTLRFHRQSTKAKAVTFADLVDGIFTGLHSRLLNSRVDVETRDRTTRSIRCFEGEIRQVLVNLISNAVDAMQNEGGTLFVRGRDGHDSRTGLPGIIITVADPGSGMSEISRAKIFDAFYTTKGIGGTGLGLWISKEIIDRHQGSLNLKTDQHTTHHGTVFTLFLPVDSAATEANTASLPSLA
jgi:PAS domain S-box-containing protein